MAEIVIGSIRATYNPRGDNAAILCPPHPLMGGDRFDIRLDRIASELIRRGISVLRFDYGQPFRSGIGEIEDAKKCISYLKDRHNLIGVVGYSFGSVVASNVADYCDSAVYISPIPSINSITFSDARSPKLFVIATKDQFVSLNEGVRLYEEASPPKQILKIDTDHFYFGKFDILARAVADFIQQNF
ncbi:alpha/beta hydrolase [Archaeoglobus neptunius]|uniref:alpha/beta hydrolase n=1 Tax=Archaeoglobus neptunius TaxID=2798580 RepID=UPI001926BF47|nr:alpha/beta hydrolase [Archaeoglobus neptunius]